MNLSPKQKLAIKTSNNKINIWSGAVRSGKSYSATLRFLIEVQEAPPGEMAIITRDANSFRRNVLPILYKLIGNDPLYKAGLSVIELWGRKIHLIGCHDSRAEGKIRGCTLQAALVDEASIIPESSWMILLQRVAMNNGRIFATTNPDSSMHWLKTDFIDNNQDVTTYFFDLTDNPVLKEVERDFLKRQHTGVYYRRFIAGEWCMAEGAIFEFFDERIHCLRKPPGYAKFHLIGVDIGFTNPTAFVLLGYNDEASTPLWVEDEYYWDSKKTGRQKTTAEFAEDLKNMCCGHNVKAIYIDPAAASFKIEMRRSGLTGIPIKDADNDVTEGIKTLSSYLQMGDLKIVSKCKNLIGEMQGYCWDSKAAERGIDQPIKRADHAIDAMRYAVYSHFGKRTNLDYHSPKDDLGRGLGYDPEFHPFTGSGPF